MADGFYYNIYPGTLVGGGPSRQIYSVNDQNRDVWLGSARIQVHAEKTAQVYKELGVWGPTEMVTDPVERNGGLVVRAIL